MWGWRLNFLFAIKPENVLNMFPKLCGIVFNKSMFGRELIILLIIQK